MMQTFNLKKQPQKSIVSTHQNIIVGTEESNGSMFCYLTIP